MPSTEYNYGNPSVSLARCFIWNIHMAEDPKIYYLAKVVIRCALYTIPTHICQYCI